MEHVSVIKTVLNKMKFKKKKSEQCEFMYI